MNTSQLPAVIYPDVLSVGGETYLVYTRLGVGLEMHTFPDGHPESPLRLWTDPTVTEKGEAKLTAFTGLTLVAYQRGAGVVVAHAYSGQPATSWAVACNGNSPCAWGPGGLLGVQDTAQRIVSANWPDQPSDGPLSRQGNAEGIARFDGSIWVLVTEERAAGRDQPGYAQDGSAVVWQAPEGGIAMQIGATAGVLMPGAITRNPRVTRQADGRYTVVSWASDAHGATPGTLITDIIEADLVAVEPELPPVESVPLLGRPFGLAIYQFNHAGIDGLGNLGIPIRPTIIGAWWPPQTIATIDVEHLVHDDVLWSIYCGETQALPAEQAIAQVRSVGQRRARGLAIYQDSYPMRESVIALIDAHDLATPQLYRQAGESTPEFDARMKTEYLRVAAEIPDGAECWPTINIHRRYGPDGPTLSVLEVVEGFIAASNRAHADSWPGMVLFRHGTSDVPQEIYSYIARFLSGITATPEARIIPEEPEEPDMATAFVLLKKPDATKDPLVTVTLVKEIQKDGKTFLEKPHDGGRMVCVTDLLTIEDRPPGTFGWFEEFIKTPKGDYAADRGSNKVAVIVAV